MNTRNIAYWVTTGLTAFVFLSGGAADLAQPSVVMEGMTHLGYPVYFVTILGLWKVLGGIAVLIPRSPLLKEWAYAGMFFDLTGAAASHGAVRGPAAEIATPLILLGIVAASWALRPESRKLPNACTKPAGNATGRAVGEGTQKSA